MSGNIKHLVFSVCVAFVLCAFASVASARTIYVPDDYEKIQWAVDNASAGDTIIVRAGVFHENIEVDKRLTLRSENGSENCIVQAVDSHGDVFHVTADYVNISGFTIRGGDDGIYLDHAENCNITNNNISNNRHGISLGASSNNSITRNNVSNNNCGIFLFSSNKNTITSNSISNNEYEGIYLLWSSKNCITSNTMTNDDVDIGGDELQHWNTHIIENNTVNGKPLYYFKDTTGGKVPEDAGQVILANCTGMLVENLDIRNTDVGIEIGFSSQNTIKNNNVLNNRYGISLGYSSNNTISDNNVSNNNRGIRLLDSSNNTIIGNNISNNWDGIDLGLSSNNTITGNSISNNCYGIHLLDSSNNSISDNTISNNEDGIFLGGSNNNITDNTILDNMNGIYLLYSSNNTITGNNILNNWDGIEIFFSSNNIIANNTVSNNWMDGIYLHNSSNNTIYLNNFINNTKSVYSSYDSTKIWNSTSQMTYTYGGRTYTNYLGNYWSDYTGSDEDEDGIGDTPYSIDSDKDNYPLIEHFENYFLPTQAKIFDTGRPENPYPSISGEFVGTIKTNTKIIATKLYTYACEGTGGHTEYALICNSTWCAEAKWEGYKGDWMNISFNRTVILMPHETYNITIVTGSYPHIHHTHSLKTENGWINCTEFTDANGKKYENWIPAIKLWS